MKTVIEMAREAGFEAKRGWGLRDSAPEDVFAASVNITREIERLVDIARADEREQGQRWFDAVTAQHKQLILAEREACATLCENLEMHPDQGDCWDIGTLDCADAIRARSNT